MDDEAFVLGSDSENALATIIAATAVIKADMKITAISHFFERFSLFTSFNSLIFSASGLVMMSACSFIVLTNSSCISFR
jgi:hypothetical protein